jgi:uncharacterized membrane protein
MIKVEHSVVINRPVAEVFAFITDPANETKWQEGVVSASVTSSGALGVGSEATETRKFMGRDMVSKLKVSAYEANKKFVFKVADGPVPFEMNQMYESNGAGTKISIVIEGEPGGFFKLAEGMVRKQLETQIAADFERARKLLEG